MDRIFNATPFHETTHEATLKNGTKKLVTVIKPQNVISNGELLEVWHKKPLDKKVGEIICESWSYQNGIYFGIYGENRPIE